MKIKLGYLLQTGPEVANILGQKMNLTQKYRLGKLLDEIEAERTSFLKVKKADDAKDEEIKALLEEEVEIKAEKFPLSLFDNVETEEYYPYFMKFFVEDE